VTREELAEVDRVLAQLRHAYQQSSAGAISDQRAFAAGLLAPVIRRLERVQLGGRCLFADGVKCRDRGDGVVCAVCEEPAVEIRRVE
jgi:hypothetical protein